MTTTLKIPRPSTVAQDSTTYTINGTSYPRVTTVLGIIEKPALRNWYKNQALERCEISLKQHQLAPLSEAEIDAIIQEASKQPNKTRDAAGGFGKDAHTAIEHYIRTGNMPVEPEFQRVVSAYDEWRTTNGLSIEISENLVWDGGIGYAGTVDAIGRKQLAIGPATVVDVLIIADWKTGGLYREAYLQVAAYAQALEVMTGEAVQEAWAVRIPRDAPKEGEPSFQAHKLTRQHILDNFELFKHALSMYNVLGGEYGNRKGYKGVLHE